MILREISLDDKEEILKLYDEYMENKNDTGIDTFEGVRNLADLKNMSFEKWYQELQFNKNEKNLPPDYSPQITYLVILDNKIIGLINIRLKLVSKLKEFGGLIGYTIRPCERGKGYANKMLKLGLEKLKEFGIKDVLISCKDFNIASKKVIENNKGVLKDTYLNKENGYTYLKYYIKN